MRVIEVFCILFFLSFLSEATQDTALISLLDNVSGDKIWGNVDTLTTFERYTKDSEAILSTNFLRTLLEGYNYDIVETQSYKIDHIPNVFAVKKGSVYPETYILIGAHYDVYTTGADGADDNGSGAGSLMEIARILSNYTFEKSIILVFYSGEEIGLLGSQHFADSAVHNGLNLESIINLDVIGYLKSGTDLEFDCSFNAASRHLYDTLVSLCSAYLPKVGIVKANQKTFWESSDHKSFWNKNIPGLFFAEELNRYSSDFNYNWHSENDIMGVSCNSKSLMEAVSKATILMTVNSAVLADESPIHKANKEVCRNEISKLLLDRRAISFHSTSSGAALITLFNLQGKELFHCNKPVTIGNNRVDVGTNLASGLYLMRYRIKGKEQLFSCILN